MKSSNFALVILALTIAIVAIGATSNVVSAGFVHRTTRLPSYANSLSQLERSHSGASVSNLHNLLSQPIVRDRQRIRRQFRRYDRFCEHVSDIGQ